MTINYENLTNEARVGLASFRQSMEKLLKMFEKQGYFKMERISNSFRQLDESYNYYWFYLTGRIEMGSIGKNYDGVFLDLNSLVRSSCILAGATFLQAQEACVFAESKKYWIVD